MLLLVGPSLSAQSVSTKGDYHTREDEARRLYSISAFAHGHRHGYESGYHRADEEIHYGMRERKLKERDVPRDMDYHRDFGEKNAFRRGFIHGFMMGYRDSYAREPFRIPAWLHEVPPLAWMHELPQAESAPEPTRVMRRTFDEGARLGYESGLAASLDDTGTPALVERAGALCSTVAQAKKEGFCDGYRQGFLLAVRDRAPAPAAPEPAAVAASAAQPH